MKASRQDKLLAQLMAMESELRVLLAAALPHTARHGDMLFFNADFCPGSIQTHWLPRETQALLALSKESVELHERLGLPVPGSVGELYLSACREAADDANGNRRGNRQLAAGLLTALGPDASPQP